MELINLRGQRFGRLTVIERDENNEWSKPQWLCKCDCGEETVVLAANLRKGATKSCGCFRNDLSKERFSLPKGRAAFNNLLKTYKRGARDRGLSWKLSKKQFYKLTKQSCHYCGVSPSGSFGGERYNGNYTFNGVDRVDNGMGYIPKNVVPCCEQCNRAKRTLGLDEFLSWLRRAALHSTDLEVQNRELFD